MGTETARLSELENGQKCRIVSVDCQSRLRARLADLGFVEGAEVRRLFAAPTGDPAAYLVRGAVIALRDSDGAGIIVRL